MSCCILIIQSSCFLCVLGFSGVPEIVLLRCRLFRAQEYSDQSFNVGGSCHAGQFGVRDF